MKLYYSKGACSLAVRILINELNLKAEYEAVNLKTKTTETGSDFLKINPKGAVPALLINSNTMLTENAVIHQYLAEQNKAAQLLPETGIQRYHILEKLNFITTELHKGSSAFFNPAIPIDLKENIFAPLLKKKYDYVEGLLQKTKFIADDYYTLPDGYLFVMVSWFKLINFDITNWPNIANYFTEMKKRNAIQKSLEEENIHN